MKTKGELISLTATIFVVIIGILIDISSDSEKKYEIDLTALKKETYKENSIEDLINTSFNNNNETYTFYANMFGINIDTLKDNILKDNKNNTIYNELMIDNQNSYSSLDESLIYYLNNLEKNNKELFNREYIYEVKNKDYIYGLIEYFCSIYKNVDKKTASAIAYLESGNLNAKNMMKKNNIFGGMSKGKLTSYPTIEYGVYRYIKLLSTSYYGKGLNTIESISKKYNPVVIDNKSTVNKVWSSNIRGLSNKFSAELNIITVKDLNNIVTS